MKIICFCSVILLVLSSCDILHSSRNQSPLDKSYETFIAGILTPDSSREYNQEIFVGRVDPTKNYDNPSIPPESSDKPLLNVIWAIRGIYRADIRPHTDARVSVIDEMGNRVEFKNLGNGYYRDEGNALKVKHGHTYRLEVVRSGKTYTGKTTVPGAFSITSIQHLDTVKAQYWRDFPPELSFRRGDYFSGAYANVAEWTKSEGAAFYRRDVSKGNYSGRGFTYFRAGINTFHFEGDEEEPPTNIIQCSNKISAIDSAWALLYEPEDSFGSSPNEQPNWGDWFYRQTEKKISERSTIYGEGNCGGVFGSFAQTAVTYWAVPNDSIRARATKERTAKSEMP